ncbi:hypothetical protein EDP1_4023 [Pseudomonas putida S610]|nr:hypothetical protein EDP1_4023 [Pseudomonas putida S610]
MTTPLGLPSACQLPSMSAALSANGPIKAMFMLFFSGSVRFWFFSSTMERRAISRAWARCCSICSLAGSALRRWYGALNRPNSYLVVST